MVLKARGDAAMAVDGGMTVNEGFANQTMLARLLGKFDNPPPTRTADVTNEICVTRNLQVRGSSKSLIAQPRSLTIP